MNNDNSFNWELWDRYFQNSNVWQKKSQNDSTRIPQNQPVISHSNPYKSPRNDSVYSRNNSSMSYPPMKIKKPTKQKNVKPQTIDTSPQIPEQIGNMFQNKPLDKEGAVLLQCIQQMIETYTNKKK